MTPVLVTLVASLSFAIQPDQAMRKAASNVKHIIGHRGSSADRPENTLASYRRAIEAGATIMEMDVRSTKDGALISLHDADVKRTTDGKGLARNLTLDEIRKLDAGAWFDAKYKAERIPTMREILELARGKIDVMFDLQTSGENYNEEYVQRIVTEVRKHGEPKRIVLGIRSVEQAKLFRKMLPEAMQIGLIPTPKDIEDFAAAKVDMIRLWPKWLADTTLIPRVRQHKLKLHLNGTLGAEDETRTLLVHEPDSLASDDPAQLIESLRRIAAQKFPYDLSARKAQVNKIIDAELASLDGLYKHIHAYPELSYEEEKTAAKLAKELRTLGFEVTEKIGGHGIVGVLKNGDGPTVLIRTDMDALPIVERTELPYASKQRTRDKEGNDVGIMHACGHDMHMTCWVGTARVLAAMKKQWRGTLVFIGQPAEEVGAGARKMLEDGLLKRFPRPDYCLGLHCDTRIPHGTVGYTEGLSLVNVDSVDILVKGKGGHGSAPHTTIDPIVIAARIVLDLQTLVSRENNPLDPAVVTVGSIHGGTKHNIIPAEVKMQLTVRSTKDDVRARLLEGIQRIAKAAALAAKAPEPVVTLHADNFTPALYNTADLAKKTANVFRATLGASNVIEQEPLMGGEDFSRYIRAGVPGFFFFLGTLPPERVDAMRKGTAPPISLHSDLFHPIPEPSIRTGVLAMSMAALNLLKEEP